MSIALGQGAWIADGPAAAVLAGRLGVDCRIRDDKSLGTKEGMKVPVESRPTRSLLSATARTDSRRAQEAVSAEASGRRKAETGDG